MDHFKTQCINMMLDKLINNSLDYSAPEQVIAYLLVYGDGPLVKETNETLLNMVWDEYSDEIEGLDEFSSVPDRNLVENWIMKQKPTQWFTGIK